MRFFYYATTIRLSKHPPFPNTFLAMSMRGAAPAENKKDRNK